MPELDHPNDPNAPDDAAPLERAGDGRTEEVDARVKALLESDATPQDVARGVESLEAPDAADTLEHLSGGKPAEVLHEMDDRSAAEALAHMELPLAAIVMQDLDPVELGSYLALMEPDDAVDLIQILPRPVAAAALETMQRRAAAKLAKLALYDPESAGGHMTTDLFVLREEETVSDAIARIREHPTELDYHDLYCVDDQQRLVGVLEPRELLIHRSDARIRDIMDARVHSVAPDVDREHVAMEFDRYDLLTLPVVDASQRLLGIVTIDDVIDIIRAEHTEDAFKQVGAGAAESVYESVWAKLKSRFPWLLVNLGMASLAALVVLRFETLIDELAILAVIMPVIANQAGNAGHQSMAITLRGIVLGDVRRGRAAPLLLREMAMGLLTGLAIGVVVGGALTLLGASGLHPEAGWRIGLVAGAAMAGALALGCLAGAGTPLLLSRLGFDPAAGSSIFVTMLTDSVSFAAFLGLAFTLQEWLHAGIPAA